jgi:hypothetical protein
MTPPLLNLPLELINLIYDKLQVVDQACFALITRWIWTYFSEKNLVLFTNRVRLLPSSHQETREIRIDQLHFIQRLESYEWIVCAQCGTLHPREEFDHLNLETFYTLRQCQNYGRLDLCPHTWITYRQAHKLQEHLRRAHPDFVNRVVFNPSFYHTCECTTELLTPERESPFSITVSVSIQLYVKEGALNFLISYTVINPGTLRKALGRLMGLSYFPCPHVHYALKDSYSPPDDQSPPNNHSPPDCRHCGMAYDMYYTGPNNNRLTEFTLRVNRPLKTAFPQTWI